MTKEIAQKMGLKTEMRGYLHHVPKVALEAINLPQLEISSQLNGMFDYIHFFTTTQLEMDDTFPKLKQHLKFTGMLWLSWPKNRQLDTDLTLPVVIQIGYRHGLVESKVIRIDSTWSAIKFTFPKKGKQYNNSYGKLKDGDS